MSTRRATCQIILKTNLEQQEGNKCRANTSHSQSTQSSTKTATESHTRLTNLGDQNTSSYGSNTSPQSAFAKVVGVSALRPQTSGEEIFIVLLVLLLFHPLALLLVSCGFEAETANIEEYANDIGDGEERQGGEDCCGYRVEGEDGQQTEGYPGCLGEEGAEELGRRGSDFVEARVAAVF